MRARWQWSAMAAAIIAASGLAGCAQDIGDIDRTEPNKVLKSDLTEGVWWMGQKVVDSSATHTAYDGWQGAFEGSMAENDKVRFVVEENYLMAYRSYPILPGADDTTLNLNGTNGYEEIYDENYRGSVRAMFPIKSHFDVQRTYDPATGEQSNVIVENTTDRPWYEREYMRVDWENNVIIDPWWYFGDGISMELGYHDTPGEGDFDKQPYFERDSNGLLVYFDAPGTYIAKTTFWDLIYSFGYGFSDPYAATEYRIVTSFARDLSGVASDGDQIHNDRYEPLTYDNYDMNRFGYFRVERDTFDATTGIMNGGKIQLANRHDIWESDYTIDENMNKVSLPIEDRVAKTTPFYIHGVIGEEHMARMSERIIDEWNVTFKRAVYIMQHPNDPVIHNAADIPQVDGQGEIKGNTTETRDVDLTSTIDYPVLKAALANETDIFVACHVPVTNSDPDICLPDYLRKQGYIKEGYTPREGDFRKNYLWLVNQNLENGLLGYGPAADDPLTSQTMSSQAHVYTGYMNVMANSIIDHIKLINGDLTGEGIRANDANIVHAKLAKEKLHSLSQLPGKLRNAKLNAKLQHENKRMFVQKQQQTLSRLQKYDYAKADAKFKKLTESGLIASDLDSALTSHVKKATNSQNLSQLSKVGIEDPNVLYEALSVNNRAYMREIKKSLSAKGYCFGGTMDNIMSDQEMMYFANKYKNRSDYDTIRKEIRADILRSTALHEMGHTFGLRHNFAGSFDTMNYFDNFWKERKKSPVFSKPSVETIDEMYQIWDLDEKQIHGGINSARYSSIMDYYSDDKHGLGKYDHAAIVYAYSAGTAYVYDNGIRVNDAATCSAKGGEWVKTLDPRSNMYTEKCQKFQKGLIEVFSKSPTDKTPVTNEEMGNFPYNVLTHKDTTGISTFDDPLAISAPYLELVHYRDFFGKMNQNYDFIKSRAFARVEDYLSSKNTDNKLVRVPYVFCTDDNHGKLASCLTFDRGADIFEQSLDIISGYYNNYWFTNFARGRAYWDSFNNYYRSRSNFTRLSDFFQHWYVSDRSILEDVIGKDIDLNYQVGNIAVNSILNFLSNVIATPDYGIFCKRKDTNDLVGLSTDDEARSEVSEFLSTANCGTNPDYYYVRQGEGRNRYSRFDVHEGFDYSQYEYEAPHLYTSLAAIEALFDNEADVIVNTGDLNTYLFGLYDYFQLEITKLVDAAYMENYSVHSPILTGSDKTEFNGDEYMTGSLSYPPLAASTFYLDNKRVDFDPLSGETVNSFNKKVATKSPYSTCSSDSDCIPNDKASMVFCTTLFRDSDTDRCYNVYDPDTAVNAPDKNTLCPENTRLEGINNGSMYVCVPTQDYFDRYSTVDEALDSLASLPCSNRNTEGYCSNGMRCDNGTCVAPAMRVETETSLSQKFYLAVFSMLYTGIYGSDSTLYDQFNIYRVGSGETVEPAEGFKKVTFEDPFTGAVYGANERVCEVDENGDLPIWCSVDNKPIEANGGAMLLHRANKLKAAVDEKYKKLLSINITDGDAENETPAYKKYMEAYYEWAASKYDLNDIIYDINFIRSVYKVFGSLF